MGLAAEELDVLTAETPQLGGDPRGGRATVVVVRRQRGDGRDAEELAQLAQQTVSIHGGTM
jgi:hypothetical protein